MQLSFWNEISVAVIGWSLFWVGLIAFLLRRDVAGQKTESHVYGRILFWG
jgi:hypothetical protein